MKTVGFVSIVLILSFQSSAQELPVDDWVKRLKDNSASQVASHYSVFYDLTNKYDSATRIKAAVEIDKECAKGNKRLKLMGRSVKSKVFFYEIRESDSLYASQMKDCLKEAIEMEDPYLQAEFGRWYSEMLNSLGKTELAVQYAVTSLKLHEYLGFKNFSAVSIFYMWVGEALLVIGYPNDALIYLHTGLGLADTLVKPFRIMYSYNNIGLAYRRLQKHDSALYYFEKLKNFCIEINNPQWQDIAYKNRLISFIELGMLDSAKAVTAGLFEIAKKNEDPNDILIAYEMTARIAMKEGNFQKAITALLKNAELNNGRNKKQLNRAYELLATCYESLGQPEKAYPYLKISRRYNDSLNKATLASNDRYLFIKAEYDKDRQRIKDLAEEKKKAINNRNIGIAVLSLIAVFALIWLNHRKNRVSRLQQQQASKELEKFRDEMVKKNNQIEELMTSIDKQKNQTHDSATIDELSRQIILTEENWQNFKLLFEKTYPAFFSRLKEKAPGITEAEQRMAALIKIHLSTKQIAAMQGIGTDSVHKTRHRLRQRFNTETTHELETIISGI